MGNYRLSSQARNQIRDIGQFTKRRFGDYQAKAYHAGLERTFGLLADFPKMGVAADELLIGARRFRFQSHIICIPRMGQHPHPRPISRRTKFAAFHAAQNLRPDLFD
jgi:toxin ParE1/3/4